MDGWTSIILAIVGSGILTTIYTDWASSKRTRKAINEEVNQMLRALGRDRLLALCKYYKKEGAIPMDEYESFKSLGEAYFNLGGNGTVKKLMEEVEELPLTEK